MDLSLLWQILLQLCLILLNAIFACAEIAVISVSDTKLERMAQDGNKKAARLSKLKGQPARFLATIQVAITLSGFLGSAFAADNFSDYLVSWLVSLGVPIAAETLNTVSVVVITLILSFLTLVFGELVPKRLAMKNPEKLALGMATPIAGISRVFAPLVWVLTVSTNLILRLLGIDPNAEEEDVSEEEIRLLVEKGGQTGAIDSEEQAFIQNVFEFDDLAVSDFATHRTDVSLLWTDETMEQWEQTINDSRHTFYPVCEETVDNVVGVLDARDFFRLKDDGDEAVRRAAIKTSFFVPETIKADVLFRRMKQTHNSFAVVLDEYGGMTGIVTLYDLIEQLVGDIAAEAPTEEPDIVAQDSRTWKIRGVARLSEVEKTLGLSLPTEEYDTFGGYVFGLYGSVPEDGSVFELTTDELQIKALQVKEHKLEQSLVCRIDG